MALCAIAPEVLEHVPKGSVILADDFADAEALGKHLLALAADDAAYRKHFEWDLAEFATRPTVAQCPWQCRVCEMMLARRSPSGGEAAGSAESVAVSDAATTRNHGS